MKLLINLILLSIIFNSCSLQNTNQNINKKIENNKKEKIIFEKNKVESKTSQIINSLPIYFLGEPYFIEGIEYIPTEDYNYDQTGLASFYGKELHNVKTINNEYNKVTELFARHKTLPIPSIVKITNLENGLSVITRINDRGPRNNARIIEVSRKVAQLLRFYKSEVTKVRVQILSDPTKQLKIVSQSISNPEFNQTIDAAPTESVTISELNDFQNDETSDNENNLYDQPIELGLEDINTNDLYVKISGFNSYEEIDLLKNQINNQYKITIEKDESKYSLIFGPMIIEDADNLFQILISKGYKQSKIIIK
tara:strand:+ start:1178 stop:2107 length:930 start_codon:yes stop_codon:yes gene_type:complete